MNPKFKNQVTSRALIGYINFKSVMSEVPFAVQRRMAFSVWRWLRVAGIDVPSPTGDPLVWLTENEKLWWGMVPKGRMELFAAVCGHLLAKFSSARLLDFLRETQLAANNRELAGQLISEAVYHKSMTQSEADLVIDEYDEGSPQVGAAKLNGQGHVLTRSQSAVVTRCSSLAELFFSQSHRNSILRPRVYPLIAGPTGVGKSKLAKVLAEQVDAKHMMISFARWMPQGVGKEYEPTQFMILRQASLHKRLIVQVDEIDKFGEMKGSSSSSWTKSVMQEIFAMLDGDWPMEAFRRYTSRDEKEANPATEGIFFMGSGTWQNIHANPPKSIGFVSGTSSVTDSTAARIRAAQTIPPELIARFHPELLLLNYPLPDEVPELLENYGLNALAAQAGECIDPKTIDFTQCGMRVLEGMASDLLLKIQENLNQRKPYAG